MKKNLKTILSGGIFLVSVITLTYTVFYKIQVIPLMEESKSLKEKLNEVQEVKVIQESDPLGISGKWYYQVCDEHGGFIKARDPETKRLEEKKFIKIKGDIDIQQLTNDRKRYKITGDRTALIKLGGENAMKDGQRVTLDFPEVDHKLNSVDDLAFKFTVRIGTDAGYVKVKKESENHLSGDIDYLFSDSTWRNVAIDFSTTPFE